jgi:signal transduction histidine kinase
LLLREVAGLPWISPAAASLGRLARPPASVWPLLREDPGAVLRLLRSTPSCSPLPFPESALCQPEPLRAALLQLDLPATGVIDWSLPANRTVLTGCQTLARLAYALARRAGNGQAEQAWCAGLLAPLGWLGVCAVRPDAVASCLADDSFPRDPLAAQERHWGAEHGALARRLAGGWELPGWLAGVVGRVDLPGPCSARGGASGELFSIVRLAAGLARDLGVDLGLLGGSTLAEDEAGASLRADDLMSEAPPRQDLAWESPYGQPLLLDLLAVALDNRLLRQTPRLARLEREVDELHAALRTRAQTEAERLHLSRLSALAELAAGAGHEINNPLAVISGQAQYLLGHEREFFAAGEGVARKALTTIIAQTKRIHGILRELMQFARPAPPRRAVVDLPTLLGEVAASLAALAGPKRVRVEVAAQPARFGVFVDPDQVRTALACLLQNAVEAAPAEGWARLRLAEAGGAEHVEVFVEDSGSGVAPEQRAHLFDPFYSGRSAGRGRGLGLPVAWRLARQQGGDLRLEPARPGEATRFVLVLPRSAPRDAGPRAEPRAA